MDIDIKQLEVQYDDTCNLKKKNANGTLLWHEYDMDTTPKIECTCILEFIRVKVTPKMIVAQSLWTEVKLAAI